MAILQVLTTNNCSPNSANPKLWRCLAQAKDKHNKSKLYRGTYSISAFSLFNYNRFLAISAKKQPKK